MAATVAALALLLAAVPAQARCDHAPVRRVVEALQLSGDSASLRLQELAPEWEDAWEWAPGVLRDELLTGHGSNDVWAALCAFPGDGASWAVTGNVAFDLAVSERSGLVERALDGQACAVRLFDEAVAWPASMAATFSQCEHDEIREMGSGLGRLRERLERRRHELRAAELLARVRDGEKELAREVEASDCGTTP
jgi:hypothetical protein